MTTMVNFPRVAGSAHAGDAGGARVRVPWATVLPLAVVAAYGSGFWLMSMRVAVGAIERTSGPFMAWLQESTLLLPLYVFAVLAALTLVLRWFGPGPHRFRTVAVTLLFVALASTLAAVAVQAVSAVYDYRLQAIDEATMATHGPCDAVCLADRQHDALLLQVHALGLNLPVLLVSNLVLLALVVAFRGGRLDLASLRRDPERTVRRRVARFDGIEMFLVAGLLGAAAVHVSVVRDLLGPWPLGGIALLLLTMAEVDVALLFLLRLRRVHYLAATAVSLVPLLVSLCAYAAGLPFGPAAGVRQDIGLTGGVAALLEVGTLAVALTALRSRRPHLSGPVQHPARLAMCGVVAVTVVGVAVGLGAMDGAPPPQPHHGHHATA